MMMFLVRTRRNFVLRSGGRKFVAASESPEDAQVFAAVDPLGVGALVVEAVTLQEFQKRLRIAHHSGARFLLDNLNLAYLGDKSTTAWALGITLPLPVFNRNQGNIERARINIEQTMLQLDAVERIAASEIGDGADLQNGAIDASADGQCIDIRDELRGDRQHLSSLVLFNNQTPPARRAPTAPRMAR